MMQGIPKGVKQITLATAIRWFGWGLGEAFIPVFLLIFAGNFLGMGLLASAYNIFFFLSIPLASFLADHVRARRMIMAALIIYVFIGIGYFLAGLTSAIIFIVLARAFNGVAYSLDQTGRETYILRHTPNARESRVFGRIDFITNFWWILAVVIGVFLVKYVPIHWLLLAVTPTSIISFFVVSRMKGKSPSKKKRIPILHAYKKFFSEIRKFKKGLRLLAIMYFTFGIISSVIYFFTPAIAFSKGGTIEGSVIIVLAWALPTMFGVYFGKIADRKKESVYFAGILLLAIVIFSLMYFSNYYAILATVFFASCIFELFYLANKGVIARISERTHLGEVDGSLNSIGSLGAVAGPILFGLLIDIFNTMVAYSVIIAIILSLSVLIYFKREYLRG